MYSARIVTVDSVEILRLTDSDRETEVSIAPSIGNLAYEMKVKGKNLFWLPCATLAELAARPRHAGNPFLAPWANRLDQDAFWANGKKYLLNAGLGNFARDENGKPIHGLVTFSPAWRAVSLEADERRAESTSRLEFWRVPEWMAQFPFAHSIEMTYRLRDGALEVATRIENHSTEPMPVAVGYHSYFRLHDAPRDEWTVHLAARNRMALTEELIPTGEREPANFPDPMPLAGAELNDVFSPLERDANGRAEFWVQGKRERISVIFGPKYTVAVAWAPVGRDFLCFEPMSAITNAFNLAQAGRYPELQSIPPGGSWRESHWIKPSGF